MRRAVKGFPSLRHTVEHSYAVAVYPGLPVKLFHRCLLGNFTVRNCRENLGNSCDKVPVSCAGPSCRPRTGRSLACHTLAARLSLSPLSRVLGAYCQRTVVISVLEITSSFLPAVACFPAPKGLRLAVLGTLSLQLPDPATRRRSGGLFAFPVPLAKT